jgi:hypothetical protein
VLCQASVGPDLCLVAQIDALVDVELAVTNDVLAVVSPVSNFGRLFLLGNLSLIGLELVLSRKFLVLGYMTGLSVSLLLTLLGRIGGAQLVLNIVYVCRRRYQTITHIN